MVKSVVLACVIALASTVAFAAVKKESTRKERSKVTTPATPQPKGFCWPSGMPC